MSSQVASVIPQDEDLQLENQWTLYYDEGAPIGSSDQKFSCYMKQFGSFATIIEFWRYWNHLEAIEFPVGSNTRMFREAIKPTWEDPANKNGGRWVIQVPKCHTKKVWTALALCLIGEQFQSSDQLCGIVLSIRQKMNTINIWNMRSDNHEQINSTFNLITQTLGYESGCKFEYQSHMKTSMYNVCTKELSNPTSSLARSQQQAHNPLSSKSASIPIPNPDRESDEMGSDPSDGIVPSPSPSPKLLSTSWTGSTAAPSGSGLDIQPPRKRSLSGGDARQIVQDKIAVISEEEIFDSVAFPRRMVGLLEGSIGSESEAAKKQSGKKRAHKKKHSNNHNPMMEFKLQNLKMVGFGMMLSLLLVMTVVAVVPLPIYQ